MFRLIALLFLIVVHESDARSIRDDVKEIRVTVSTKETKITLPVAVIAGARKSFLNDYRLEVIDNLVYVQAKRELSNKKHRVRLSSKDSKIDKTYILVVSYGLKGDEEINIVKASKKVGNRATFGPLLQPHELVRHAAQRLYGPEYAVEKPNLLNKLTVDKTLNLDSIYRGSSLSIRPVITFSHLNTYVHVLEVSNKHNHVQALDVSALYGRIDAIGAAFQHKFVGTNESKVSHLYIVSADLLQNTVLVGG